MYAIRLWTAIAFIFGVLPLGLSSTEMWDGVVAIHAMTANDWAAMKGWVLDSNWYLTYAIFSLIDYLQHVLGIPLWISFKLWTMVAIVGIAAEVYLLARRVFEIPNCVAAWLPALVFSFPIWYVFFSYTCMTGHLTCVWLALAGYRVIYSGKTWVAALGAVVITVSFQLASNCAFILALELGRWFVSKEKKLWSYRRSILLLLLSIAVFAATRIIWPPIGSYVGYNRFLNPLQFSSWAAYAKYSVLFSTWLVLLVPVFAGLWVASTRSAKSEGKIARALKGHWKTLLFFIFLALAASFPYIAVGLGSPLFVMNLSSASSVSAALASNSASGLLSVWYGGWGARHMLLMLVPMVLFVAWLLAAGQQALAGESGVLLKTLRVTLAVTITTSLAFGAPGHWAKLERIADQRAMVQALIGKPLIPFGQVDILLESHTGYVSDLHETNYVLYLAYKSTHWAALMVPEATNVRDWGSADRQLKLTQIANGFPVIASLNVMRDYLQNDQDCKTIIRVRHSELSAIDVLWKAEHQPQHLPKTTIEPVSTNCKSANEFWRQNQPSTSRSTYRIQAASN
jgi:hypothetical protein